MAESTSVKLRDGIRDRIRALASETGTTPNQLMNEAILQYVERREKRAAFLKEARERWQNYKITGERIPLDEAEDWIDQLLAGGDPEIPSARS